MLVLFESPAGYAIFKLMDEKRLRQTENLFLDFETPEQASKVVKLKHFEKFNDMTDALSAATAAVEGKMTKRLKKLLKKVVVKDTQDQLAVADAKLGNIIKEKLQISCVSNTAIQELMRCIRSQMDSLITGLPEKEMAAMALGLAHSLSRYKLKFSPDKIDTMIIQAVSLLDDLDKELNNYIMRCKEWYGWHFPELSKIITDNTVYVKTVQKMGLRTNAAECDFSDLLPEDLEQKVKEMSEISMGTEISDEDMFNINHLCNEILEMQVYRSTLYEYLKNRMMAVAPNLTVLVGDLVGARLISHAGSLLNLAKHPASTVQILGAEKALFRALKTKHDTPKYGLLYHAQLVGQSNPRLKGKASRMLAAKAALACRVDALREDNGGFDMGAEHKVKLEARIKMLEEGGLRRVSGTGKKLAKWEKYENKSEVFQYKAAQDSTLPSSTQKRKFGADKDDSLLSPKRTKMEIKQEAEEDEQGGDENEMSKSEKKKKKKKHLTKATEETKGEIENEFSPSKKKKQKKLEVSVKTEVEEDESFSADHSSERSSEKKKMEVFIKAEPEMQDDDTVVGASTSFAEIGKKKKKKKKSKRQDDDETCDPGADGSVASEKKKKHATDEVKSEDTAADASTSFADSGKKKKKKKSKTQDEDETCDLGADGSIVSEKKKKHVTDEVKSQDAAADESTSLADSGKKKKKRKSKMPEDFGEITSQASEQAETSFGGSEKKKKKKHKHPED